MGVHRSGRKDTKVADEERTKKLTEALDGDAPPDTAERRKLRETVRRFAVALLGILSAILPPMRGEGWRECEGDFSGNSFERAFSCKDFSAVSAVPVDRNSPAAPSKAETRGVA